MMLLTLVNTEDDLTERQKWRTKIMCEYCEGKKSFKPEYTGKGIHTMKQNLGLMFGFDKDESIAHIKDRILYVDNSSKEYAELGFKINYCPNCGEKMRDEGVER